MAYSAEELELYNWLRSSLPRWLFQDDESAEEIWGAIVEGLQDVRFQIDEWLAAVFILTATGIWLNQHARDRGTFRQLDETDAVLRDRLRTVEDAITPVAIKAAVESVLVAAGVVGDVGVVELRRDHAFMGVWEPRTGTGGTFQGDGSGPAGFTPDDLPWEGIPIYTSVGEGFQFAVVITNAVEPDNETPVDSDDFLIQGLDVDAVTYDNDAVVAGADATVDWEVHRYTNTVPRTLLSASTEALPPTGTGRRMAYFGCGYRMAKAGRPSSFIVILPFGTTAATALAVTEALRRKKAAGFRHVVERRINPP